MAGDVERYALNEGRAGGLRHVQPGVLPPLSDGDTEVSFVFALVPGNVHQEAEAAAVRWLRKLEIPYEIAARGAMRAEIEWQTLWRVMRDPASPTMQRERQPPWRWKPLTKDVAQLRTLLTDDERAKLMNDYLDFEEVHNPRLDTMTAEAAAGVVELLKKKDLAGLVSFGSCALANYLLSLADPLTRSSTASSSPGSSSDLEHSAPGANSTGGTTTTPAAT